jgi:hypothetical protein
VLLIVAFQIFVALMTEAALISLSIGTASRLKGHAELPMQWQLDGTVTRMAPRSLALAFTPVLTVFVLTATVALSLLTEPRPGQAWVLIPLTLFVGFTAVSAHAFHLWMMKKLMKG